MVNVGSILSGAFGLVRRQPASVAVWGLVYFGLTVAASMMMMRPFANMSTLAAGDPQAAAAQMMGFFRYLLLFELAMLVVFVILYAAPMRAVLRPAAPGFFYLRLGMDELRLFALSIIMILLFYAAMAVGMIILAILGGILSVAIGPAVAVPVALLCGIALFGALVWLWVRFSLVFPLTLRRRKIIIGESWRLTRGRFWSLFGAYFVIAVIVLIILSIAMSFTLGSYWSAMVAGAADPQRAQAVQREMFERMGHINAINVIGWILSSIGGAVTIALYGGAMATAVRELIGDEDQLSETFA